MYISVFVLKQVYQACMNDIDFKKHYVCSGMLVHRNMYNTPLLASSRSTYFTWQRGECFYCNINRIQLHVYISLSTVSINKQYSLCSDVNILETQSADSAVGISSGKLRGMRPNLIAMKNKHSQSQHLNQARPARVLTLANR